VVFGVLVLKLSVWCGAECYVSGLRAAADTFYFHILTTMHGQNHIKHIMWCALDTVSDNDRLSIFNTVGYLFSWFKSQFFWHFTSQPTLWRILLSLSDLNIKAIPSLNVNTTYYPSRLESSETQRWVKSPTFSCTFQTELVLKPT
jgi:hypothetical protein